MTAREWPFRVAMVGAGTMGIGISHVFAASGITTVLVDATPELSQAQAETETLIDRRDRHAIVTGAGRGIGRAAALALAEAGAARVRCSRTRRFAQTCSGD